MIKSRTLDRARAFPRGHRAPRPRLFDGSLLASVQSESNGYHKSGAIPSIVRFYTLEELEELTHRAGLRFHLAAVLMRATPSLSDRGNNDPSNLITVCEICHNKIHGPRTNFDYKNASTKYCYICLICDRYYSIGYAREKGEKCPICSTKLVPWIGDRRT